MHKQTFTVVCGCVNVFGAVCAKIVFVVYALGCDISQLAQHLQKGVMSENHLM